MPPTRLAGLLFELSTAPLLHCILKPTADSTAPHPPPPLQLAPPEFVVSVSFLELYRGTFYDLFDSTPGKQASNIKILDDRNDDGSTQIVISNVTKVEVQSVEELMG